MAESGEGNWTYADYLNLHPLLDLQGEDRGINSDEMHFIIVHQTFELWFKQVIRELSEVRDLLSQVPVPEDQIPKAVDHLGRTTEIFRLMANQWTVLETLTPQGFLAFRDGLGTASGFESFQMREFEFLLGLENEDRIGGVDPLDSFVSTILIDGCTKGLRIESVGPRLARAGGRKHLRTLYHTRRRRVDNRSSWVLRTTPGQRGRQRPRRL